MKVLKVICAIVAVLSLTACKPVQLEDYTFLNDGDAAPYTLSLDVNNGKFYFTYATSRVQSFGKYTIEDGILRCETNDKLCVWLFKVVDENTLSFIEEGSIISFFDGTLFTKKEK